MKSYVNENIKVLRNRMGITQEKFAELIGLNRKAIGAYEEGRATPPLENLNKISNLFGITLDQLTHHNYAEDEEVTPLFGSNREENHIESPIKTVLEKKTKPFSRTGTLSSIIEEDDEDLIRYISYPYFDKYLLDENFETKVKGLPGLRLPFLENNKSLRAFDVPSESYFNEGIIIAERVIDLKKVNDKDHYLVLSFKKGFILKRLSRNEYGDFQTQPEGNKEKVEILRASEIKEIWKPVGIFNDKLPLPQPDFKVMAQKLSDLKNEIDGFL